LQRLSSDDVLAALTELFIVQRPPAHIRSDQVAECIAREARWPQQDLRLRWLGFEGQDAVALGQRAFSPDTPADQGQVRCLLDERVGDAVTVAAVAGVVRAATSPSRSAPIAFG
jgi:hypothetical protein